MSRRYSQEERSIIAGAELALSWQLVLLRGIDPALPRTMLAELLEHEEEVARRTTPLAANPSGQT
jgi:hypothetical protein